MTGFAIAFSEITLVLFTTLAPSGAVAYVLMNLPVLVGRISDGQRCRLDRFSCLPLAITMVGLIASATHLGNPSNALYVFTGVGRSPLSTEVFCAVIFLALAGVYWLYSFAEVPRRGLQRVLLVCIDAAAVVFVAATAFAYHVATILTWSLPLVPVSLMLNALVGGPVIALLGFACVEADLPGGSPRSIPMASGKILRRISLAALIANTAVYGILGMQMLPLANELAAASQLVPAYPLWVGTFVACGIGGLAMTRRQFLGEGKRRIKRLAAASALVLLGIFLMRFTFYMSHLTAGLGV